MEGELEDVIRVKGLDFVKDERKFTEFVPEFKSTIISGSSFFSGNSGQCSLVLSMCLWNPLENVSVFP